MRQIWIDPARLGGTPCFTGTRVPLRDLFDYVSGGDTIDEFLRQFPTVSLEQVQTVLGELIDAVERLDNLEAQQRRSSESTG